MRKFIFGIVIFFMFILNVFADGKVLNMYLFYGESCPHCIEMHEYLDEYLDGKDNIKLYEYEIYNNKDNANKLRDIVDI